MSFMDEFKNTPEAESKGFSLLPEGDYQGQIDNCTLDMTKATPKITIVYKLLGEYAGRKLFGNYNLAGQGLGILKKDLKQLGLDYSAVTQPGDLVELVWSAVNTRVDLYIKHREYNAKMYESVYLNGVGGAKKATAPTAKTKAPPKAKSDEPAFDFT
jgi:hypothetical protein